jgi:hypothetical protein
VISNGSTSPGFAVRGQLRNHGVVQTAEFGNHHPVVRRVILNNRADRLTDAEFEVDGRGGGGVRVVRHMKNISRERRRGQ